MMFEFICLYEEDQNEKYLIVVEALTMVMGIGIGAYQRQTA